MRNMPLEIIKVSFLVVCVLNAVWQQSVTMINARPINIKQNPTNIETPNETFSATQKPVTLANDDGDEQPSEIQKAVCTVTAGDVKASAEAVTTKALKGVCGANEMTKSFKGLEEKIFKELELLEGRLKQDLENIKNLLISKQDGCNRTDLTPSKSIVLLQPIPSSNTEAKTATATTTTASKIKTKSYSSPSFASQHHSMPMYSSTLPPEKNGKIFTYLWRIENFTKKIENNSDVSIQTSPSFSIKGKNLKVKASFQHLHRDFLYLQLIDVSASLHSSSAGNSVILDTGGLFKQITNGNLKYKMSIVAQNSQNGKDLVSQEFDSHESGFLIPNSALLDSPFIKDDSLLIKVILYL